MVLVTLHYFKGSGKYYSSATVNYGNDEQPSMQTVIDDVNRWILNGDLPGLNKGARFDTLVNYATKAGIDLHMCYIKFALD